MKSPGRVTTYRSSPFREPPVIWHYNQTAVEYAPAAYDEVRRYGDVALHT